MSKSLKSTLINSLHLRALSFFLFIFIVLSNYPLLAETGEKNTNFKEDVVTDFFEKEVFKPLSESEELDSNVTKSNTGGNSGKSTTENKDTEGKNVEAKDLTQLTTVLNVTDADIEALVKTFSKLTGRNYIVDSNVKGKITIHLPSAITISDALKVFDSILLLKGFATVPVGDNIWKVINAKDAKQTTIPQAYSRNTTAESLVTEILKTTHVSSDEIQKLVAQFISKDGFSQAISGTNLVILVDTSSNIDRIKGLLSQIDIPPLDQDITIIAIEHAEAKDVAEKITKILGEDSEKESSTEASGPGSFLRQRLNQLNNAANTAQNPTAPGAASSVRNTPMKIIPDERTNSLIVVADEFTTLKIRALSEQLDSEGDKSSGRFWVYRLEHADAEILSQIISGLIGGGGGGGSTATASQGSSFSRSGNTSSNNQNQNSAFGGAGGNSSNFGGGSRTRASSRTSGSNTGGTAPSFFSDTSKVAFEDEISVAADPSTNSLVINANKSDYEKLTQVIKMLDVKRRQVLVEATIMEVSLNDEVGLGLEFQGTAATETGGVVSQTNYGSLTNLLTNPSALSDLTIAAASTGTLTLPGGLKIPSQAAILTAVSKHSNINVLSAPTILSTDNEEAEIIVGENVPFVSSTGTNQTNLGNTFNQIQRQDVGITLRITPQLGTGDFLSMKIFVEISNVVTGTRNDPNGPTTSIRTTDTLVAVKNGQMIVTGGLIQDSVTTSTRGVPYLEDVPVLGMLFKREDDLKRRTNLLILLTPQIIHDQYDARDSTLVKRDELAVELDPETTNPKIIDKLNSPALNKVFESSAIEDHKSNIPITGKETVKEEKAVAIEENSIDPTLPNFTFSKGKEVSKESATILNDRILVFKALRAPYKTTATFIEAQPDVFNKFQTGSKASLLGEEVICIGVFNNIDDAKKVHKSLPQPLVIQGEDLGELAAQGLSLSGSSK